MTYKKAFNISKCSVFIRSKNVILNVVIFKHSLRKFGETILHEKYQLI